MKYPPSRWEEVMKNEMLSPLSPLKKDVLINNHMLCSKPAIAVTFCITAETASFLCLPVIQLKIYYLVIGRNLGHLSILYVAHLTVGVGCMTTCTKKYISTYLNICQ